MIDMIGVGPFITIPLIIGAMGGPQAMLGWMLGAVLAICDGLVWAELGAAMPGSGGSYRYLREIYGPNRLGRLISFLFIWQLSFSAPLSIASGASDWQDTRLSFGPGWSSRTWLTIPTLCSAAGQSAGELANSGRDASSPSRSCAGSCSAISQDHQHRMDVETLWRRDLEQLSGSFRRAYPFQCGAGIRFSARGIHASHNSYWAGRPRC